MAKQQLKEQKDQLPANVSFEEDAGQGFEGADVESFAVPFLTALQSNSPQLNEDEAEFVEGAKKGMLINTVTNDLYPARKKDGEGVNVIPCAYKRQFIEWKPRGTSGGGLVAIHDVDEGIRLSKTLTENSEGKMVLENGNTLADTRMHYVLMQGNDGAWHPIILSMTSTQIKKSRKWMTIMDNIKFQRADGSGKFTPPMFSHVYRVSTVPESNDKGSWHGYDIALVEVVNDAEVYKQAKDFREKVVAGDVEVAQPVDEQGDQPDI